MLSKVRIDRHVAKDGTAALKITFTKDRRNVDIPTGISVLPSQWDGQKVVGRPDKAMFNAHFTCRKTETDAALLKVMERRDWNSLTAYRVRDLVLGKESVRRDLFIPRLLKYAETRTAEGTRKVYIQTCRRITAFCPDAESLAFSDIPKETIAAGLGHGGNTVTDIYIDFDRRKVDEANRRVIDWVLYGTK